EKPDCLKVGDGYYFKGCSTKSWRCFNSWMYTYECRKGLYFNPLNRKCEDKADIPLCSDGLSADVVESGFNCTGKYDGYYKAGKCHQTYWICFDGKSLEFSCPKGLVYDDGVDLCQHPVYCDAENDDVPCIGCVYFSKEPEVPTTSFDCSSKLDGL
ncbi:hypothetical protein PFISCL1PPCAC_26681, partial [Pristionchus fissidentatus]